MDVTETQNQGHGKAFLGPVVQEFKEPVEGDAALRMLAASMFLEVPNNHNPIENIQARGPNAMFHIISRQLLDMSGSPISNWPMEVVE